MKKSLIKFLDHQHISWVIILLIFSLQFLMTQNSLNQIRFEELSESVRNVYFLDQRQIFDGISSNVGWYGTILVLYKLFGFNLFLVKFYKLIIFFLALISFDQSLKHFKVRFRSVLLLLFGLSPTVMFFNTLQAGFGIDLLYFLIVFNLLIISQKIKNKSVSIFFTFFVWFLIMVASMSYGPFLAYLPLLGLYYLVQVYRQKSKLKSKFAQLTIASAGFFMPLLLILNYMKDPAKLLYDPSNGSGLFRGGGVGEKVTSISILLNHLKLSLSVLYKDLFISGQSYYYEPVRTELSHQIFPFVILVLFLISIFIILKYKKSRLLILSGYLLMLVGIMVGGASDWFPGIRRMSPVMMGFLVILVGMWMTLPKLLAGKQLSKFLSVIIIANVCLMILHHLKVYPANLAGMKQDSLHKANSCFYVRENDPRKTINFYIDQVENGQVIAVDDECRLHELYPLLSGACQWNNLDCYEIKFDPEREFKKPK